MTFAHPALLLLLLLLPAGVLLVRRSEKRRQAALARFGNPDLLAPLSAFPDGRRREARNWLRLAALACLIVAAARPQAGEQPAVIRRAGRDVLVLLDLSRSMNVSDAGGTRLGRAKTLLAELAAARPLDRLGLIVFGGSAFLQLPLTTDHDAFRRFVEAAATENVGDPSTDVSAALAAAATAFEHAGEPGSRAVVLVSDGERTEGALDRPLARLRREEVPVFAIGVGSVAGGNVPADSSEAPEPYHRDNIGRIVVSRLDEADLRKIAEQTGGAYARWDDAAAIQLVQQAVERLEARPITAHKARRPAERFQWPLGAAVLLLMVEWLAPLRVRRPAALPSRRPELTDAAVAVGLALLIVGLFGCSPTSWQARRAERRYDAGDWPGAFAEWSRALEASSNPVFGYDAGNALYRQKQYKDAATRWRAAATDQRLRQRSAYNQGNAAVRAAEDATGAEKDSLLDGAVAAFEEAVRLGPADQDAKWNLEIALRRRGDRPEGSSSGRSRRGDYGQGNQNVPGMEGKPEAATGAMAGGGFGSGADGESVKELDPTQARQLLDAVQREQLASHLGRRTSHPSRGEKDW
ncbi:MAG TPA: VWA domain-containing protein [Gemmatimonadales bacterium]|nr:VWA domain-containing protein [Gemmatimonadales bacterium]